MITPVEFYVDRGWFAKREDLAERIGPENCSGAKVRQYLKMVKRTPEGTPCAVGCSATASMQLYVADVAQRLGRPAFISVPQRKKKTALTEWAEAHGAKIDYLKCGWPNYVRQQSRLLSQKLGAVRWDRMAAVEDARTQVSNLRPGVQRIVVACGSGLIATGIALGLMDLDRTDVSILLVDICGMVKLEKFHHRLAPLMPPFCRYAPKVELVVSKYKYGELCRAELPTGDPLDGNYAAKCVEFLRPGDCLWVSGMRPISVNS